MTQQAVRVFVRAALPRALRIAEVNFHFRVYRETFVLGHFQPAIPGQRTSQSCGQLANVLAESGDHGSCVFAGHLEQYDKSRMSCPQSCDMTVLGPANEVALPMAGDGAILDLRRPFSNGNGIDDLTLVVSVIPRVPRAANSPLEPKMLNQLFFQHSTRLNEQAAVNGLVGHAHTLVLGILNLQPSGNLFWRPVQDQFTRNDLLQLHVNSQKAPLGSQGRLPGLVICFTRSILRTPTMPRHLPAHRRHSPLQTFSYLTNGRAGSNSSRNVLALCQCKREQ